MTQLGLPYNERKLMVLRFAIRHHKFNAVDLAGGLDVEGRYARILLLKYHRMGLLHRRKSKEGTYDYEISMKGLERFRFLLSQNPDVYQKFMSVDESF